MQTQPTPTHLSHPFSYPVSNAGLPRRLCLPKAINQEPIQNLTAQNITRLYWLLHSVHISIALQIADEPINIAHTFAVTPPAHERLVHLPALHPYTHTQDDAHLHLDLALTRFSHQPNHHYSWPLSILYTHDELGLALGTHIPNHYEPHSLHHTQINTYPLTLTLSHAQGLSVPLQLTHLKIATQFYTATQPNPYSP